MDNLIESTQQNNGKLYQHPATKSKSSARVTRLKQTCKGMMSFTHKKQEETARF